MTRPRAAVSGPIWAVARMTLLESSRRKVFGVLLLFGAALVASVAFFPAMESAARLRLIEAWSLRTTGLFTAIVAIFVTGLSLPGDFEAKRIYLVATKPISKVAFFLGRFAGFFLVLLFFLALMGGVTLVFIRLVAWVSGPTFPTPVLYPRLLADVFTQVGGGALQGEPDRLGVDYGPGRRLGWRFHGLRRSGFPDPVRGQVSLVLASPTDPFRFSGTVLLKALDLEGKKVHEQKIFLHTREESPFEVPSEVIPQDGTLDITVAAEDPDGRVLGGKESVVLHPRPGLFEVNYMMGMALGLFQATLLMALVLAGSTFLSSPMSILAGLMMYLVGSIHSFALEGTRDIERALKEVRPHGHAHLPPAPGEVPRWMQVYAHFVSKAVLEVAPDFQHFDFGRWLLRDRAVAWNDLGRAGLHALVRVCVLLILGMGVMRMRDFSS